MKKRLYRDTENQKIAGVCAGLAKYLDVDVTVIRIVWVIITLAGGYGIIPYLVCWLIMPTDPGYTEAEWHDVSDKE